MAAQWSRPYQNKINLLVIEIKKDVLELLKFISTSEAALQYVCNDKALSVTKKAMKTTTVLYIYNEHATLI